jgi:hypothetical protein
LASVPEPEEASVKLQGAPASVTVKVCPATVSVPVNGFALALGAAVNDTSAVPALPDAMMFRNPLLETAVQVQAAGATTLTVPKPPAYGIALEEERRL